MCLPHHLYLAAHEFHASVSACLPHMLLISIIARLRSMLFRQYLMLGFSVQVCTE